MKGPCVIYCETEKGARFGGFNSEGFKSSDDYSSSSKAFLFCWTASDKEPIILRKVHSYQAVTHICGTLSLSAWHHLKAQQNCAYTPIVHCAAMSLPCHVKQGHELSAQGRAVPERGAEGNHIWRLSLVCRWEAQKRLCLIMLGAALSGVQTP